jgi:hypothetical protein
MTDGNIHMPLPLQSSSDFPIVQHADDTFIIMQADVTQLLHLKELLQTFGDASRLKVNYAQPNLFPINIPEDRVFSLLPSIVN